MRVRITVQPTGLLNGLPWPEAGEEIDLPDVVAEDLVAAGAAEAAAKKNAPKVEKRPAPAKNVETRES